MGAEEADLEHTSAMVEVGEAIASVRAEANTGMCAEGKTHGLQIFSHC